MLGYLIVGKTGHRKIYAGLRELIRSPFEFRGPFSKQALVDCKDAAFSCR
jgi:hypothetical protein